jgi:heat-inducible transcriptional repressor
MNQQSLTELTERRKRILRLVIQEYVCSATPVASETLVKKYDLGVSSATVRNELAALEEQGLLTHPHTSAGRVPTDLGYRFFVESLMTWSPLPSEERRMIRHQFYQVRTDMDEWTRLAATALARLAGSAAMVTPARAPSPRFKHIELLSVSETRVLMVLILRDGTIRQHILTLNEAIQQEELRQMTNRLNNRLANFAAAQIANLRYEDWSTLEKQVLSLIGSTMQNLDRWEWEEIVHDGVLQALSQPEFAELERAHHFLEIINQGAILSELLSSALDQSGIQIIIGGESQREELRHYSMVVSRYGLTGRMEGALGILGPTRMPYPRSVSAVHFIARMMSEILGEIPE